MSPLRRLAMLTLLSLLPVLFTGCASYVTTYSESNPIIPEWHQQIGQRPMAIGLVPFQGRNDSDHPVVGMVQKKLRNQLAASKEYSVVPPERLLLPSTDSRSFTFRSDRNPEIIAIGRYSGAHVILVGIISEVDESTRHTGEMDVGSTRYQEYRTTARVKLELKAYNAMTGERVWEFKNKKVKSSTFYTDPIEIGEEKESGGFLSLLGTIAKTFIVSKSNEPQYGKLTEEAVAEVVNQAYAEMVTHVDRYEERYELKSSGERKLISRRKVSSAPVFSTQEQGDPELYKLRGLDKIEGK